MIDQEPEVSDPFEAEMRYANRSTREANRPDITDLIDAVQIVEGVGVVFLPEVGDRVLIERCVTGLLEGSPWLDTKIYVVKKIDEETGDLTLWDPSAEHWASSNYLLGQRQGQVFKIPPPNWDPAAKRKLKKKRKRVVRMTRRTGSGK